MCIAAVLAYLIKCKCIQVSFGGCCYSDTVRLVHDSVSGQDQPSLNLALKSSCAYEELVKL